ncbi:hypothetical protein [Desulfosarcina ovata]|uniref:Uncharacterized protein n=1 Tax=Desulfosarcina ovata subsp. ovata TaxID=2752305 RepID=A0A5K8A9W4_9BACT|nr:hypothetical protein [Desulfosarcina ovata]BBO88820.1 hypothetical protein DSCOOX_20000 [Desulfosarcina ovata subsp. ovata]
MSLTELVACYLLNLLFWLWVVRWGGAEWLEGTLASGFLVSLFAPRWSAEGIKLFGVLTILISTILFLVAIFCPDFRYFFS